MSLARDRLKQALGMVLIVATLALILVYFSSIL